MHERFTLNRRTRVVRMLEDAVAEIPQARLCAARELTKKFEEFRRGSPTELLAHFQAHEPRGEFCIVIAAQDRKARRSFEGESSESAEGEPDAA